MTLAAFLASVQESGHVRIESLDPPEMDPASEADALQQLLAMDERRRLEMAYDPPPLRSEPALWGARLLYRMCQFLVFRQIPGGRIESDLSEPCPGEAGPARTYSVDLSFCRLPELLLRAANIASADPLVRQMQRLAWEWPLSSVGVEFEIPEGGPEPDLSAILGQRSLRQLYVDRILERGDYSRLHHPRICNAVADAIGRHPALAEKYRHFIRENPERLPDVKP